ncbi:MAG: VOC family protein [Candidatus Saccharibacteria bacterium]|nr:VOC family protein [Candidatus Saccharibacteria bacterium]
MHINSISSVTYYIIDIEKTAKFYEALGFRMGKQEADSLIVYVNWFGITFRTADAVGVDEFKSEFDQSSKGAGHFLNMKVANADKAYGEAVAVGVQPTSEPVDKPWGSREFTIIDPDGYKLVFFEKK